MSRAGPDPPPAAVTPAVACRSRLIDRHPPSQTATVAEEEDAGRPTASPGRVALRPRGLAAKCANTSSHRAAGRMLISHRGGRRDGLSGRLVGPPAPQCSVSITRRRHRQSEGPQGRPDTDCQLAERTDSPAIADLQASSSQNGPCSATPP